MEASAATRPGWSAPMPTGRSVSRPKTGASRTPSWSENGWTAPTCTRSLTEWSCVEGARLNEPSASKARFAARLLLDAAAPTNQLLGNLQALRRALETGGLSVLRGARHFLEDVASNGGWPRQVDTSPFTLGENITIHKGQVVYRNELVELIRSEPQTPQVHAIPDAALPAVDQQVLHHGPGAGGALVEWCVQHGLTTFALSYRNPDSSMRDLSFDDYMIKGPHAPRSTPSSPSPAGPRSTRWRSASAAPCTR